MDAERLEAVQICGARIRAGDVTGTVESFRTGRAGWLRLRDGDQVVEVSFVPGPDADVEVLDPVDEDLVARVRQDRVEADRQVIASRRANAALDAILADPDALARLREALA